MLYLATIITNEPQVQWLKTISVGAVQSVENPGRQVCLCSLTLWKVGRQWADLGWLLLGGLGDWVLLLASLTLQQASPSVFLCCGHHAGGKASPIMQAIFKTLLLL